MCRFCVTKCVTICVTNRVLALNVPLRYLQKRGENWHYVRRIPREYQDMDPRDTIRKSLKTKSLAVACARRDSLAEADDLYWASISTNSDNDSIALRNTKSAINRYEAAKRRAMAKGFLYTPNEELLGSVDIGELLKRIDSLSSTSLPRQDDAEAILGIPKKPSVPISVAFEIYCNKIAVSDLIGKSESQTASWKKIKKRAVSNFVKLCGDTPMREITRDHAREFYNWWAEKVMPSGDAKPLSPNSGNRDIGNLRKLYSSYWEYEGEESRENPFRNLNFTENGGKDVPHFEDDWVLSKILEPSVFEGLNSQAIRLVYALIETGCRPSEIANILPENIVLNHAVPHIKIRKQGNRQLKTISSIRDIPLVGVSLSAMKQAKEGFPKYHDKGNLLSVSLLKTFRRRGLFPTPDHRIYSFRHSFEKRMLEAGLDYDLRCLLMGHKNTRPKYGDGGSLEYRRSQLLIICHPVPSDFEGNLRRVCALKP